MTKTLSGEPPEGEAGSYRVVIKAIDEFGQEAEQVLTIDIGDNRAPRLEAFKVITLQEDGEFTGLNIEMPNDPEGTNIVVGYRRACTRSSSNRLLWRGTSKWAKPKHGRTGRRFLFNR